MSIRHRAGTGASFRFPLMCAGRALGQFPLEAEKIFEEVVAPLCWCGSPGAFETTRNCVDSFACAEFIIPTKTLLFNACCSRFAPNILVCISCTVCFTKRVTTGNKCYCFFVIHSHAAESLANVASCCEWIRVSVRALWVHVYQTHLNSTKRILQFAITCITFVSQPSGFRTPIHIFLWFPNIFTSAGETKSFEAHRLERAVARENHQVGPRNFVTVFLFDWPKQQTSLVEVGIVGPAVERSEALLSRASTAATIGNAVGASRVPCHPDKERTIVTIVGRPPIL